MTIKDILVHVDGSARGEARLELALALAAEHEAHLVALHVRGRTQYGKLLAVQLGADMDGILARDDAELAAQAQAQVEARRGNGAVSLEWRDVVGDTADTLALHGRYCDLVVIGQTAPDDMNGRPLADNLVLAMGRPVMVVPHSGTFPSIGRRVLVAWNGSREATRAIHDALPILARASSVRVIAVNPGHGMSGHGELPGADICLHLSRHGVNAIGEHIRSDEVDAGAMLLNRAMDEDCDLVVMGGYGRSRLREMVLGGATHHLLQHMTVPVLFSH
ncbi:universal stress protein UspA [Paramagnetospirillum marisnigri]|uniref:Universal stress protein UspA n=1 Tax=Paramagnetospirillum marisnigri TaxID=1285242 RepID=A0A178MWM5_9PROT|nr:universal stress protein [Paramagnetospirillum marisnigri]OAN53722.1 universal stress protein UspA [Paramagnetospirillum marisnigri]